MGARFYDEALLNKLKRWTEGTSAMILGVNESRQLFETLADKGKDKPIDLPLIALKRNAGFTLTNKNQQIKTYRGAALIKNQDTSVLLNAIPIEISYQLDIYTRYFEEADEYARNFIFNIMNYPTLQIEIPYESTGLQHNSMLQLISDVEDNSSIPERLVPGQFTRITLGINILDAYLFDTRIKSNIKISPTITADILN